MLTMPAWDLRALLTTLFALYVAGVAIFIILDNRSPQSTFAWLFLLVSLPVVGLLVYIFFGRSWHAFSGRSLSQQIVGSELNQALMPLMARHSAIMERIAKEKPESYNRNLLNLIANNSGSILTEFNDVEILQDARVMYPRLLEDLRRAQSSIHLEFYIWTNDEFTQQVKDVLIERAQAGVRVHALYDAFTGRAMGKAYRNELLAGGVDIRPYLAHKRLRSLHNIQYRNHRKITVIDGKIGYVGGMNLDKEQLSGPKGFSAWRDTHLRIHGEAALALQASFVVSWHNSTQEKLTDSVYFPIDEIRREVATFTPVQIAQSGPDSQWSGLRQLYFFLIMAANHSIRIQSPFFIPDESISEALKSAALAGVDVRMIFQPRGGSYQLPYRAAYTYYAAMARAGARIFLYQNDTYFHPKTINIDGAICSVGSANMDIRSFSINYEINAVIYDQDIAGELARDFVADLEHCTEFSLQGYENAGIWRRFADSLYRLASPIL